MINAPKLLADLTKLLKRLESDLLERIEEVTELKDGLQAEWEAARDASRNAETFETWVDQVITQAGVHWLLSCVFLRFIEDNQLVDRPWLGGTPESGRLDFVRDRHEAYFRAHPLENDRHYLLSAFHDAGELPGLHTFFDEVHNPVFRLGISGDAAMALRQFWQRVDANTGVLLHDFTDPAWNTRFLGDLYQDLSKATRDRYALLQTPEFVEEFILDRTLAPAIREFGFRDVRMIDPTCGSGHFLLGGFHRLLAEWQRNEPSRNLVDIAQKALDGVAGVDLNPFAVAISRFRLFVAALQASGVRRLVNAYDFKLSVATGDSLLHGTRFGMSYSQDLFDVAKSHADTGLAHAYASEDLHDVQEILGRRYHAVVGNPPYIVVKDTALNTAYRARYASCHRQYSLGVPFTQRFFELAVTDAEAHGAGYVGLITANSFMKREFGTRLIEHVLPRVDLTHVVDTAGAYIPGHGTPTVVLFGRNRAPVAEDVRTVMGIKGEPSRPNNPADGLVWNAITAQIDRVGSESDFVSVADIPRTVFANHPWSIGGGGAADLKGTLEETSRKRLSDIVSSMGFFQDTHADDVFVQPKTFFHRMGGTEYTRPCARGDGTRDWTVTGQEAILFPYDENIVQWHQVPMTPALHWLWGYRTTLWSRSVFGGKTYRDAGRPWWDYHQFPKDRARAKHLIAFSEIATHNHFVLEPKGIVFNRTAPVIKLQTNSGEDDHLGLLGLLNSSIACFWLKQVCHNKGSTVDQHGARQRTSPFEDFYALNSTKVGEFPLCLGRPLDLSTELNKRSRRLVALQPVALLTCGTLPTRASLDAARDEAIQLRGQMIAIQEELDWRCYRLYNLLPDSTVVDEIEWPEPVEVALGERAFEIVLARRIAASQEQTTWFERHGSTPITEIPAHWPDGYRRVVARRMELIESDKSVGLIERPEFKRRWNTPLWRDLEQAALREWLLARLEVLSLPPASAGQPTQLSSTSRLAEAVSRGAEFMQVAALYAGHADFDLPQLVAELVAGEAVPALPVQRYTDTGLRKRVQWQDTWSLQRREDAIDVEIDALKETEREKLMRIVCEGTSGLAPNADGLAWIRDELDKKFVPLRKSRKSKEVGNIPVPPKYQSKDFLKADFWRLRGGLDVPKERWISFPGCERGTDGSLVIAWAGWNHLQQATAIAGYYINMKDAEGWEPARLQPLLASLLELVPWLEQWHNELDPLFGERMGDYYRGFVTEEARAHGFTLDDLRNWKPAVVAAKRGRRKAA